MTETFRTKAPWIMSLLMRDFGLDQIGAAAICGNLGHESGGLASLQEISPTVKNSKGGYGWAQWTGPRRRDFFAYCDRNHLNPASDEANYKWLFLDLSGDYKNAIAAVKKAQGLEAKVQAFEQTFEKAGIKHYESRNLWAARALEAYRASPLPIPLPGWVGAPAETKAATGAPQVGEKPNVTVVEGTKPDETQVVIVKTPQNPPATHPLPSNAAGFTAFGAMLIALIGGALKYFGAI